MTARGGDDDAHTTDETLPMESGQTEAVADGEEVRADGHDALEDEQGNTLTPAEMVALEDEQGNTLTPDELDALDTLVGQTLSGRYTVLDRIGSGGMSIVYRARHEMLKQFVAVKVLKRRLAADRVSLTRFHREAMAAASIGDPHIVHITDYGFTKSGDAFIVMEHLEGMGLRQTVRAEGPLVVGRAVSITRQILRGLAAAHEQGIVHRDLKSDNVFLTNQGGRDFVKLLDFGISKLTRPMGGSESAGLTSTGVVMGTPQYIAPEQASGLDEVDHRADIYAMGVMLYEMLTGVLPFEGSSPLEILMKHVQDKPKPPRKRRPDLGIPADLDAVVLKALAKDPGDRFASADAMRAALPEGTDLPGGFASGTLTPIPGALRGVRMGTPLAAGLGALLLIAAIAALLFLRSGDQPSVVPDMAAASAPTVVPLPQPDMTPARSASPDAGLVEAAQVLLEITAEPNSARVLRDGVVLGVGAVKLQEERGDRPITLEARAPGHRPKQVQVTPDRNKQVTITLERVAGKPKPEKKPTGTPTEIKDNPYKSKK